MLEYATLMKQMAQFIRPQGKHLFLILEMNLNICQQKLKICRLYDSQGVFLLHDDHLPLDPNLLLRRRGYQPLLQRCCLVLLAKTVFSFKVHHYSNLHPMNRKKQVHHYLMNRKSTRKANSLSFHRQKICEKCDCQPFGHLIK